jgi:two-component system, OmpR family, sensor histidine kinase VanS
VHDADCPKREAAAGSLVGARLYPDEPVAPEERIGAAETLLPLAERRGVTVETAGEATDTVGSHALLLQVATNLVHNAIVHNLPQRGNVWVRTSVHANRAVLTVENTGEQLAGDVVATLAEPFQRGTERIRTDHAGVGLGLAIVQRITQAHDGALTIAGRPGGGLRVTMELPAAHSVSTGSVLLRD